MKKLSIATLAVLLSMIGYSVWNRHVRVPGSNLSVRIRLFSAPRLWGNAVEFDHWGWQEICYVSDSKTVKCDTLKQASPPSEVRK